MPVCRIEGCNNPIVFGDSDDLCVAHRGKSMTTAEYEAAAMRTEAPQMGVVNRLYSNTGATDGPGAFEQEQAMRLCNAVRGLCADAGEVAGCAQKYLEYGKPLDVTNLKEEVGDCLWRLVQVCKAGGFTLEDAMVSNIAKLKARYPQKFENYLAHEENRNRTKEREAIVQNGHGWAEPVALWKCKCGSERPLSIPCYTCGEYRSDEGRANLMQIGAEADLPSVESVRELTKQCQARRVEQEEVVRRAIAEDDGVHAVPYGLHRKGVPEREFRAQTPQEFVAQQTQVPQRALCGNCRCPLSDELVRRLNLPMFGSEVYHCPGCQKPLDVTRLEYV